MKKIFCLILSLMLVCSTALAMELDGRYADGKYSITGKTEPNIPVKIEILQNGEFDASKAVSSGQLKDSYLYIKSITSDSDGDFAFEVPVNEKGNFIVNASDFNGNKKSTSFVNYTYEGETNDVKTAVSAFAEYADKSADKLEALVKTYYTGFGIDWNDVNKIGADKAAVFANAFAEINELSGIETADITNIVKKHLGPYAVVRDGVTYEKLMEYASAMEIQNENYYADFSQLTPAQKEDVCSALAGKSSTEVNSVLRGKTIVNTLKNIQVSAIGSKLEYYKDYISYDLTNISGLSGTAQSKIYTDLKAAVTDGSVASMDQLEAKLASLKDKYKNVQDQAPVFGGGGGSSSGGGGFGGGYSGGGGNSFTAGYEPPKAQAIPFTDLETVEWASNQIIELYNKGIVNGTGNGRFNPNNTVTREEFTAMLVRALGLSANGTDSGFGDVPPERWSSQAVIAAKENGIVKGISDTLFGAKSNIKRCDMAVMAYNALKKSGAVLSEGKANNFSDKASIPGYAEESVNILSEMGVIKGNGGSFLPNNFATRAEAAVIIYRVLGIVTK